MDLLRISIVLMLVACGGGGDKGGVPDADPAAPVCTGVVYDNCTSNDQCDDMNCHEFSGEFRVCTKACTPNDNSTCPLDKNMQQAKCNNRGICKPLVNNDCRPPA